VADIRFALNHMAVPRRSLRDFFALARALGIATVEIRNDLEGRAIADGTSAGDVRAEADRAGVSIASINALYPFNIWNDERDAQARRLIDYAAACDAKGIVMCPLNDPAYLASEDERLAGMRAALTALKPMLASAGVTGLVEPLGFAESSLRLKREAIDAIRSVDGLGTFALVHDTFHHHVAGETELFPDMTGLVHVSGVVDPTIGVDRMREELQRIRLESTHTINIENFVARAEVDERYLEKPYYLAPEDKVSREAFAVIRDAMREKNKAGLGRLVLARKERVALIEPFDKGMMVTLLRAADEVRSPTATFEDIADFEAPADMRELAAQLIERNTGAFDPSRFEDRYELALTALVQSKAESASKGGAQAAVSADAGPSTSNVVSLMEALKRSIRDDKTSSGSAKAPDKPDREKAKPSRGVAAAATDKTKAKRATPALKKAS